MKTLITSVKIFLLFTILTGVIYPLLVTGIAQVFFPGKSNGSLLVRDSITIGSELIGQKFDSPAYFSSRPSFISYNPLPSGGSNYGMTNIRLKNLVTDRKKQFITFNQSDSLEVIPSEMLFASASGLDPHISPEAALMQVIRIVKTRQLDNYQKEKLLRKIEELTEPPQFSFLGETRINVLNLNLALDKIAVINTQTN